MQIKESITIALISLALSAAAPFPVLATDSGQGSAPSSAAASANPAQVQQPNQGGVNWKGVGVGAGTVASNVLYIPFKLAYGILGGVAGGAGYVLTGGNRQVADTIWRSSLGGDYVVTPDMVTGNQPLHVSGPTQTASVPTSAASSSTMSAATPPAAYTQPPQSSSTSLSAPPSSESSAASNNMNGSHPMDSGAGPVSGSTTTTAGTSNLHDESWSGSSYPSAPTSGNETKANNSWSSGTSSSTTNSTAAGSGSSQSRPKAAPLPDTSIE